jgi:DNA repair exonuclease SbcCD nuclease subunit
VTTVVSESVAICRFLHASDLHLGAHQYTSPVRANDYVQALSDLLDLAISKHVDFILWGGDTFTSLEILPGLFLQIVQTLKKFKRQTHARIPIIAIEGNHDLRGFVRRSRVNRGQSWLKVLAELDLIIRLDADMTSEKIRYQDYDPTSQSGGKIRIKNAVIYGNHYIRKNVEHILPEIRNGIVPNDHLFHILLQHFGIQGEMPGVPGVQYQAVLSLRDRIDYLALGHFHLGFQIRDWIFNPGSPEAVSASEHRFKRGVFLVKVDQKSGNGRFQKKVELIQLQNRFVRRETIRFPQEFHTHSEILQFVQSELRQRPWKNNLPLSDPLNPNIPILYVTLKGKKPALSEKTLLKQLRREILDLFPVIDVKIYLKFGYQAKTLESFLFTKKSFPMTVSKLQSFG